MSAIPCPRPGSLIDARKKSRQRSLPSSPGSAAPNTRSSIRRLCRPRLECLEGRFAPAVHDTLAAALPIVLDANHMAQVAGQIAAADQVDLYAVQLGSGDQVSASIGLPVASTLQGSLRILDNHGVQLASQQAAADLPIHFDVPAPGLYFIGISSAGNLSYDPNTSGSGSGGATTGAYTLTLADFTLGPTTSLTGNDTVPGAYAGTPAYFSFSAAGTGDFAASVSATVPSVFLPRLILYSDSGQLLIQSDATADAAPAQLSQHLQPGDYYLAVSAVSDNPLGDQSYDLTTSFVSSLPAFQALPVGSTSFLPSLPAVPLPLGGVPQSIAAAGVDATGNTVPADFKHDGNTNIVTANSYTNTVSVLLGNGDGTFQPAVSYAVGQYPDAVALGDFTHNGNLDIVTANAGYDPVTRRYVSAGSISILLGRGDGTFAPATTLYLPAGKIPSAIAVGDFNNDGNLDIVTTNVGDNSVSVWLGQGNGSFTPGPTLNNVGIEPAAVAVADFNHDGQLDIAVADFGDDTVKVWLGNGDGSFQPNPAAVLCQPASAPSALAVGDFNHDGNIDIAAADAESGSVSVWLGQGDGIHFTNAANLAVGNFPQSIAVGDFNHDGNLDIAAGSAHDQTVSVWLGEGDGSHFTSGATLAVPAPSALTLGVFDNDGNLDIASNGYLGNLLTGYVRNTVSVLLGRGDGSFLAPLQTVGKSPDSVAAGDLDHTGNLDVVTANYADNTVSVLLGRGDGTFLPAVDYPVGAGPFFVTPADLNGDGNLDIIVANQKANTVSVLLGRGDGTFLPAATLPVGDSPNCVAVGDFNNDGHLDLAVTNFLDDTVSIWVGAGDGFHWEPGPTIQLRPKGSIIQLLPESIAAGDLAHNGKIDLVVANTKTHTLSILAGQGDGTFLPAGTLQVIPNRNNDTNSYPYAVALADFNHDENLDIVTANYGDNSVSVWLRQDDGIDFGTCLTIPVGNEPESVAPIDVNGDGNLGLAVANFADSTVAVLPGNGDGTFGSPVTYAVGESPAAIAVADFNNDQQADIVTANGDNTVSVLLGKRPPSFSVTEQIAAAGSQFSAATPQNGVAIRNIPYLADLDGDGLIDSVILDSSGFLLFRRRLLSNTIDQFAPPVIVNPNNPARDATIFKTASGWGIAAVDDVGNVVSIYLWSAASHSFQRTIGFTTGDLPVRIAAADFTGNGLDDLVVASDFDHSIAIVMQTATGEFTAPVIRPVGIAPSDISFANLGGKDGRDIVVSDQVSGDFTVLFNDASHLFSRESRYRAGSGPFDIDVSTGEQTIVSQLQTVGIVGGNFTGSGNNDLIALNRGTKSFTLFPNQGGGRFAAPQGSATVFPTSDRPGQILPVLFPGDRLPSIAVLMADLSQIWIYHNNGDGTFAPPAIVAAGNSASGFAVVHLHGKLALLVGNPFGDVLTLLYEGQGWPQSGFIGPVANPAVFAPDPANLQNAPLAIGKLSATGQEFAVVAKPDSNEVSLFYRMPGTAQFASPVPLGGQAPLVAPGAVQTFPVTVNGTTSPYLAVTNSLSNNVLVYEYDSAAGGFTAPQSFAVGFDPVSITVADVNGDNIPDLLVANRGSNDVSVLIGSINPATQLWTATPYQRLKSGGNGPIAVAVRDIGSSNGPNLLITNSDGKVALLPAVGSGFFQDTNPQITNLGNTIVQSVLDPITGQFFVVGGNGSVQQLTSTGFVAIIDQGVATLDTIDARLVAGLDDGSVALFDEEGALLSSEPTGFTDELSALAVLQNGSSLDVFATARGSDTPVIVPLPFISIVTELPSAPAVAEGTTVPGFPPLVLVATLTYGGLTESRPERTTPALPEEEVFGLFAPPARAESIEHVVAENVSAETVAESPATFGWQNYPLGASDALPQQMRPAHPTGEFEERPDTPPQTLERFERFPSQQAQPLSAEPQPEPAHEQNGSASEDTPVWSSSLQRALFSTDDGDAIPEFAQKDGPEDGLSRVAIVGVLAFGIALDRFWAHWDGDSSIMGQLGSKVRASQAAAL